MPFPLGAVIGAVGSLAGGLFSSKANASATAAANRAQIAAQKKINMQNRKLQMRTNTHQVRWLVEDAKKAGIHPLAALGSSIAGNIASPVMTAPSIQARNGDSIGAGIASGSAMLGQGIDQWLARQNTALQNEALMIQNARSRSLIAGARAASNDAPTLKVFGLDWKRDPRKFSSGQEYENEYSEVGDIPSAFSAMESLGRTLKAEGTRRGVPFMQNDPVLAAINYALSVYARGLVPRPMTAPAGKGGR